MNVSREATFTIPSIPLPCTVTLAYNVPLLLCSLSQIIGYRLSRSAICMSRQIPQLFLSPHHSVNVALPPESTCLPSESSFPFLLALFSSRLPSSLSFTGRFTLFPPKSPARGLFLRCQPHPIAFTTGPNPSMGFPGGSVGRNTGRCGFDPWVEKIPRRGTWKPTPVFLPGDIPWREEPGGIQSVGPQRVRHN